MKLIHTPTGNVGVWVKKYKPTGKPETLQIKMENGQIYFAPFDEFAFIVTEPKPNNSNGKFDSETLKAIDEIKNNAKMNTLTASQNKSIANYRAFGIDVEILEDNQIKITQSRLVNGYILNQKQLVERAKEIFPDAKIIPVVYSLQVDEIDIEWIKQQMEEFGIKRKDLIKQLAIDKSSLSEMFSGNRGLTKSMRATFFYYFLTYKLNRDLREQLK